MGFCTKPHAGAEFPCIGIFDPPDQPAVVKQTVNIIPQLIIDINEMSDLIYRLPWEPVKETLVKAGRFGKTVFFPEDHYCSGLCALLCLRALSSTRLDFVVNLG